MTEKEATGEELNPSVSLFGEKDFARMEGTVKLRKEYQDLSRKLGEPRHRQDELQDDEGVAEPRL